MDKRFRFESYNDGLKHVHLEQAKPEADVDGHFYNALEDWRQLNLSPTFVQFAHQAGPLAQSIPLLLHNWQQVFDLWINALQSSDDEGLRALLDLLQKLLQDLHTTLSPVYTTILDALLKWLARSIPPEALTTLLSTFAVVFKHLLDDRLEETWKAVHDMLPKCLAEIQRAFAEVWGAVLRRLKVAGREKAVVLMVQDLDRVDDAVAWVLVSACKSVSQTLHTSTQSIFTPLLNYHLTCSDPRPTSTLIRRYLTALIHHVKNAEQFSPISQSLIDALTNADVSQEGKTNRLLQVVAVPCSARQGSRLTETQLGQILNTALAVPINTTTNNSLLQVISGSLLASEMPLWLTTGRKVLENSWSNPSFAISLYASLAELHWGGWKMIAVPVILKRTHEMLEKEPQKMIRLLGAHSFSQVDVVWKERMNKWVYTQLDDWHGLDYDLRNILALSPYFSSEVTPVLIKLIERFTVEKGHDGVLALLLRILSTRPPSEWSQVAIVSLTRKVLAEHSSMADVLEALVAVVEGHPAKLPLDEIYSLLQPNLLSHNHRLRLQSLRFLASSIVQLPSEARDGVNLCLRAEEISMDVKGVRERVLLTGKVAQLGPAVHETDVDLRLRWLTAQLKVNLKPLWAAANSALEEMVTCKCGEQVWSLVFDELKKVSPHEAVKTANDEVRKEDDTDPWEQERSWRDPSAHKLRSTVFKWTTISVLEEEKEVERFDAETYELQLLNTLQQCSALAEKHNRDLIPFFLATRESLPRKKLCAYLTLFSKFSNPKALHATNELHSLYVSLLSHPDRSLRQLALNCLFAYKSTALMRHEDKLQALLDETRWRDELSSITVDLDEHAQDGRLEFIDTLIRLLFGTMLDRKGKKRQSERRAAVLSALSGCTEEELLVLVDLMLEPLDNTDVAVRENLQMGFLILLKDVLRLLGTRLVSYWPRLLDVVVRITAGAHAKLAPGADIEEPVEEDIDPEAWSSPSRTTRTIRQQGIKRLTEFFKCPVAFDFTPYLAPSFSSFISPRISSLPADNANTQNPSALLELFHVWSSNGDHVRFLVEYDQQVLPSIYNCLVGNVKPAVTSRVLDIVEWILSYTEEYVVDRVLRPHISLLLGNLAILMERTKNMTGSDMASPLVQREISVLSNIAPHASDSRQAETLVSLFLSLLQRPAKMVPEKMKVDMLNVIGHLIPLVDELSDSSSVAYQKLYAVLSRLFQSLRSRQARVSLISAFKTLSQTDVSMQSLADFVQSLNAYSLKRIDEPDFDLRLKAFAALSEQSFSLKEWLPLLYNMMHFLQDANELAIRSNASQVVKHFIDLVASDTSYQDTFSKVVFPGLKNGLRSRNEQVRGEVLGAIAYAVARCNEIGVLQDMRILLANGDEEANFFNNIQHVQIHRRTRALRRLADLCDGQPLKNSTLTNIILPLIGNYVTSTSFVDHHLVTEAITTTGRLSKHLSWSAYNGLVQRYLRLAKAKDESERVYVRALVAVLENFRFAMGDSTSVSAQDEEDEEDEDTAVEPPTTQTSVIADVVTNRLLPTLLNFVELRNSTTEETVRIPVATGIVNVAKHLPESTGRPQISRLLTILSQVFRSKSQDLRDVTRETLTRITIILGPSYLPLVLHELRGALVRGPHLHVLAFLTHSLLTHVTDETHSATFHTLDDCVVDVAHISAEVIFGESGKDTEAEGFKTKLREVKGSRSKGLDSFGIIAKYITPQNISSLLLPLRSIMQETETLKTMQLVEEVLKRIATGLNANKHLVPSELISLCHTLITQNARFLKEAPTRRKKAVKNDVVVQLKRETETERDHYANNSFRFVAFGLDIFNTALRRSRFDFHDSAILSRLESMVVAVGNTLYSSSAPVLSLGVKCVAGLVKCPLKSLEKSLPVFIRQILDIVKQAGNTEAEVVQTCLKSLATILRDGPNVQVKEQELVYLLELIGPDLEEPERQASVFTMLRAIVARKFVVPEIYDLMQKVSEVMVTSQSPQVQELCRGVLLQFLLDYPQGKGRLRNQMTFLAKNLSYVHESGRRSVMELLSAVIDKFQTELVMEYSELLFVALVMVVANDESAKCKEMASQLIKLLLLKQGDEQQKGVVEHLHAWSQEGKPVLVRVSFQIYGLVVDALEADCAPYVGMAQRDANAALEKSTEQLKEAEQDADAMQVDLDWQVPYYSLIAVSKMLRVFPDRINQMDWSSIVEHLIFPHAWVRTASCRLLGVLYSAASPSSDLPPMTRAGMMDVSGKLCLQLKSEHLDEGLSLQIVKNLFYIGKCLEDEDELPWLFSKISYQARSAHIARRNKRGSGSNWSLQPLAILRWFAAMASHMDAGRLEKYLVHVLTPLYRIVEDDTIHDAQMTELKTLGIELQDLVQEKVGTTKFSGVYSQIRQGAVGIQRERKANRALQNATNPEAAGKRKMQKSQVKKESRKRKNQGFVDGRGRHKVLRVD